MIDLLEKCQKMSVDELKKNVAEKISSLGNYNRSIWPNLTLKGFYRARIHNRLEGVSKDGNLKIFENENEFWNPPAECIKDFGRCNDIGESLLYCTNNWETAIAEVKPSGGKFLSMSIFELKDKNSGCRIAPIGIHYLSKIDDLVNANMFKDFDFQDRNKDFVKLDSFLDDLFHLDVKEDEKYKYKISIAVTKCLMKSILTSKGIIAMDGVMYSSIVRDKKSFNIALRPIHVRTIYSLLQVQTFKVLEVSKEKISMQLLRNGYPIVEKSHPMNFFKMDWNTVKDSPETHIDIKL